MYPNQIKNNTNLRLCHFSWQGLVDGNITFADELDFDIQELDSIYENNDWLEQS